MAAKNPEQGCKACGLHTAEWDQMEPHTCGAAPSPGDNICKECGGVVSCNSDTCKVPVGRLPYGGHCRCRNGF